MNYTKILKCSIASFVLSTLMSTAIVFADDVKSASGSYTIRNYTTPHALGYVRQQRDAAFIAGSVRERFVGANHAVPAKASLRYKAGPVEDQGQCGSCWDFSLTSALRGTWITHGKDPGRLSFNYLLNCDTTQQGCGGGDFSAAAMFLNPKGAPAYGADGEYQAVNGKCISAPAVASTVSYKLLGDDGGLYPKAPVSSFQDIAYVVGVLHQPVSIDVAVDNNWQNYGGGVYDGCSDEKEGDINHMVVIEGYDCEGSVDKNGNCAFDANGNLPAGVGTWLIRNSWGESWGDGGYITTKATDSKGAKCNAVAWDALYFNLTGN